MQMGLEKNNARINVSMSAGIIQAMIPVRI